jgi:2-haloacid dehalogenase
VKPVVAVFDLFGTLLDIASLRALAAGVAADPDAFVALWRDKQIAYSFAGTIMGIHEDFDAITARALAYAAAKTGTRLDAAQTRRMNGAWHAVTAYPDAAPLLRALRGRGLPCVVLTNGTPAGAAAAIANAGIAELLDPTLSIEAVGAYKPDPRVYALVTERYAIAPEQAVFVTSNGWDATGAAAFGLQVAWCNRSGAPAETFGPPPRWTVSSLDEVAALAAAEWTP